MRTLAIQIALLTFISISLRTTLYGQGGTNPLLKEAPAYDYFHQEQDYSYLGDSTINQNWSDRLKTLANGNLSLGGDIRFAFESFRNEGWNEHKGSLYSLQRIILFGDYRFKSIRFYTELEHSSQYGRPNGSRFIDDDDLALFQGFIDFSVLDSDGLKLTWRSGRQVFDFGTGLMVAIQGGPNLRTSHDGVSLNMQSGKSERTAFISKPVDRKNGVFDNGWTGEIFWGLFNSTQVRTNDLFEYYYFGLEGTNSYQAGRLAETRHSIGVRYNHVLVNWNFDIESTYQFGDAEGLSISAWQIGAIALYKFSSAKLQPTFGLHFLYTSGDGDIQDDRLGTFQAPFQKIFVGAGLPAGGNYMTIQPAMILQLGSKWKLVTDYQFIFRNSIEDAIYGPYRLLVQEAEDFNAKFIGNQLNMELHFRPLRQWAFYAKYAPFFNGDFLSEIEAESEMAFFRLYTTYFF